MRRASLLLFILIAAPGAKGSDITIEQQESALAQLQDTAAYKQAKIDLQRRVIQATISGEGWDAIPPDVRKQADTPWFRSWLLFDPAQPMDKIDAPILILHGALDSQMRPENANRLEALATARDDAEPQDTSKIIVPDVNHLLIPARTGAVDEYETLDKTLSPALADAITTWLGTTLTSGNPHARN